MSSGNAERDKPPLNTLPRMCFHRERFPGRVLGQFFLGQRGRGVAYLCGPGGDAEFGFHHWLLLAQCHHTAAWDPDGQVWASPDPLGWQVMLCGGTDFIHFIQTCSESWECNQFINFHKTYKWMSNRAVRECRCGVTLSVYLCDSLLCTKTM